MPSIPDFLFSTTSISEGEKCSFSMMKVTTEGSIAPERVPIIKPSSGVKPIEVSAHTPSLTAVMEHPLPKWQVIILISFLGLFSSAATRSLTKRWEVPCAPYLRTPYFS